MDSTFFLTVVAAEIGSFKMLGAAIGFVKLLGALFFMAFRIFRDLASSSSSSPPPSLCSLSSSTSPSPSPSSPQSSSSPLSCKWTHDVFPSFRGEDVRKTFLSHIQKEFRRKGITPFVDNNIKRGESIGPELIQAIRRSKIAVVVLSRNYASSKWCLDELAEIMKCKKELGQTVFAIFYEVDPSHVKKRTGDFGAVFKKTCAGKPNEEVERWRQALSEVATVAGYHSNNWDDEAVMIENIVTDISIKLIGYTPSLSRYIKGLIGMGAHMEEMEPLICLDSDEVRMIGIWGPPGIGKTTIARFLYDQISGDFQLSVFMEMEQSYARQPRSDDYNVKLHLEQQLLSHLTNQKDIQISHLGAVQNFLMDKKALVVLDGVDKLVQLDGLPKAQLLGPGTRIIITTQDLKILKAFEIEYIYRVIYPPPNEALQIFCMNAFGQTSPKDGFEKLAWEVANRAGWLPLGLRIMGSHLRGMSKEEWEEELPRLRIRLDGEIGSILKLSYDALGEEDKDLFLYIACFFENVYLDDGTFEDVLRHKFSNVQQGLQVLVHRSLLSMDDKSHRLSMHGLLVQLGREIVRNKSIDEAGKRQFLVDAKEICEVLTDNTGSRNVIGINIDLCRMEDDIHISERAFEEMFNLQLLRLHCSFSGCKRLQFSQGLKYLSSKLRILEWYHYPMKSLPSTFNPKFLVDIKLKYSKLEKLWEGIHSLGNLKKMDLSYSIKFKELPDLSSATNLQMLNLCGCSNLVELPSSLGNLTSLYELYLNGCSNMVELPSSFGKLTNLKYLDLSECSNLVELPSFIGNLTNLQDLHLNNCSDLVELPSSLGNLINLQELNLNECSNLVKIPSSIGNLQLLKRLNSQSCTKLEVLPVNINLGSLEVLDVTGCSKLRSFPEISTNIEELKLCGTLIEEVPLSVKSWSRLHDLEIPYCKNLGEFPNVLNVITMLVLNNTEIEEFPQWVSEISGLEVLELKKCRKLESIPRLPDSLWSLVAHNCNSLERISHLPDSFRRSSIYLQFINCRKLNEEARDIIIQSSSSNNVDAILPGREVPEFFTYRSKSGGSVKANLGGNSLRFQACISLVCNGGKGARDNEDTDVYCEIVDKQSGLDTVLGRYFLRPLVAEHLYTFQVKAHEVKSGELFFEFKLKSDKWGIAQCGIRQLCEDGTF